MEKEARVCLLTIYMHACQIMPLMDYNMLSLMDEFCLYGSSCFDFYISSDYVGLCFEFGSKIFRDCKHTYYEQP
jgi:hypothetical protein